MKIMIIDDDKFYLSFCEQCLKNLSNFDIIATSDEKELSKKINDHKPDIIFLDSNLDSLKGLDILSQIKSIHNNIYVVVNSSEYTEEIKQNFFKNGAFEFIIKNNEMEKSIQKAIENIKINNLLLE